MRIRLYEKHCMLAYIIFFVGGMSFKKCHMVPKYGVTFLKKKIGLCHLKRFELCRSRNRYIETITSFIVIDIFINHKA